MKATRGHFLRRILGATLSRRCTLHDTFMTAPFSSSISKRNEPEHIADSKHDLEALHRFTSGRWLWNERQQLACRYVNFDLSTLVQLAASATGSRSCTEVLKISEGQYNKVFQLTMNDGREIIAKLPNPNAGRPHFTTASEVATMDFLRNVLNLPVPRVYAWCSRASENPLGAEYILMEKQAGIVLTNVWDTMKGKQKVQILDQIVDIERRLAATKFSQFGSLYYKGDLPDNSDTTSPLYVDSTGNEVQSKTFGIGPTNHRSEDLGKVPLPPNLDSMDPDEQRKAKALHRAQTLHNLYLVRCLQVNETVFQAIQSQNTLRHQVSVVPGLVLMDYEPLLNDLLRDVKKEWAHIIGAGVDSNSPGMPFPLQFSDYEIRQQEQDGELWAQGVELMNAFVDDTGCFKHWDGRVRSEDYEKSRRELDEGVRRFLEREARNEEERRAWLKALPFVD
ncbi:kinase-like domain-containing protein [Aspergillus coremiiformis]|uniref:Altered inheritance of mitochondria protein 9, mitochondrial n=1 Tax=Aspergillus coremiiformis TaxID=138285 RepID=A0A5N6ZJB0_9EURO|nr:kinase-like domain-containing protein [Aspergillus coremiiformis]